MFTKFKLFDNVLNFMLHTTSSWNAIFELILIGTPRTKCTKCGFTSIERVLIHRPITTWKRVRSGPDIKDVSKTRYNKYFNQDIKVLKKRFSFKVSKILLKLMYCETNWRTNQNVSQVKQFSLNKRFQCRRLSQKNKLYPSQCVSALLNLLCTHMEQRSVESEKWRRAWK